MSGGPFATIELTICDGRNFRDSHFLSLRPYVAAYAFNPQEANSEAHRLNGKLPNTTPHWRTTVCKVGGTVPHWNQKWYFDAAACFPVKDRIVVHVRDDRYELSKGLLDITSYRSLGFVSISLEQILKGQRRDEWFSLHPQGEIHVTLQLAPVPLGWEVLFDNSGRQYYGHPEKKLSTYHHPMSPAFSAYALSAGAVAIESSNRASFSELASESQWDAGTSGHAFSFPADEASMREWFMYLYVRELKRTHSVVALMVAFGLVQEPKDVFWRSGKVLRFFYAIFLLSTNAFGPYLFVLSSIASTTHNNGCESVVVIDARECSFIRSDPTCAALTSAFQLVALSIPYLFLSFNLDREFRRVSTVPRGFFWSASLACSLLIVFLLTAISAGLGISNLHTQSLSNITNFCCANPGNLCTQLRSPGLYTLTVVNLLPALAWGVFQGFATEFFLLPKLALFFMRCMRLGKVKTIEAIKKSITKEVFRKRIEQQLIILDSNRTRTQSPQNRLGMHQTTRLEQQLAMIDYAKI